DDQAARHVLASVVADAFDDGDRAAVAHGKSLAGDAAEESLTAGRAVERDVADQDVLLGLERGLARRPNRHQGAGQALARVVVRVTFKIECHAGSRPRAEALAGRSL